MKAVRKCKAFPPGKVNPHIIMKSSYCIDGIVIDGVSYLKAQYALNLVFLYIANKI